MRIFLPNSDELHRIAEKRFFELFKYPRIEKYYEEDTRGF